MSAQAAFELWGAAIEDKERLYQKTLGRDDTAANLTLWLEELTDIRDRLADSKSKVLATQLSSELRMNFVAIADQVLANVEKSLDAMRAQISAMN